MPELRKTGFTEQNGKKNDTGKLTVKQSDECCSHKYINCLGRNVKMHKMEIIT